MSKRTIIYRNVAARMALLGIKKTELAKLLDMNYSTLQGKLRGRSSFSLVNATLRMKLSVLTLTSSRVMRLNWLKNSLLKNWHFTS